MKKFYPLITGLFLLCNIAVAQTNEENSTYHRKGAEPTSGTPDESSFAGYSGTGANMNVVYQRVNWTINPLDATKTITGLVTTHFRTLSNNVNTISFDLHTNFNNASLVVKYHSIVCARTLSGKILTITLPSTIATTNTLDSISINYSGAPPNAAGAAQGYSRQTVTGPGYYITTLSESYEDRDWWPCKADMQDKIDAMDIYVTVPWGTPTASDTFWVACNGKLMDSTITGTSRTFYFKTRYPIASYLVAVSVAKFDRYYRSVNVNGTITPVVFNLLRGKTAGTVTTILSAMDKTTQVLSALSNKVGDYPFKLEKHGFYDGLIGAGGMEHQTFSCIAGGSLSSVKTLTHELAHQWFGDNVTFATWNDLWLAEGFARYSEAYAGELVSGTGINVYTTRNGFKSSALGYTTASAWIPNANAANSDLIWNSSYGGTVYERGAMIISMLRAIAGDAKFSEAMTNYQTDLAGKSATTDSLRNHFNRVLGQDISEFFRDYVGGSGAATTAVGGVGHPTHSINWGNPSPRTLRVSVGTQTRSGTTNVTYFNGPIVLHVTNAATGWTKDTTIVIYDWGGGNLSYAGNGLSAPQPGNMLQYNDLSFVPTNVFIDDSARTMSLAGTVNKISIVDLKVMDFTVKQNTDGNYATISLDDNSIDAELFLERSSNGTSFSDLGIMNELQVTALTKKYGFNDPSPLAGNNYYRVRFKDATGQIQYSKIIKIAGTATNGFQIVNNPVKGNVRISAQHLYPAEQQFNFRIYDAAGKLLFSKNLNVTGNLVELQTKNLPKGSYVVAISSNEEKLASLKFIIE